MLEQVHGEEERAHQSILTQRAHWAEALQKLNTIRTSLVDMLTHLDDHELIVSWAKLRAWPMARLPDWKTLRICFVRKKVRIWSRDK